MRLFAAAWPPAEICDLLEAMPRPEHPAVRWTTREEWHVTLRFFGALDDGWLPELTGAVAAAVADLPPRRAVLGPATERLGRGTLMVPVAGLDDVAEAVRAATRRIVAGDDDQPFRGHLTVARARGRRTVPAELSGIEVHGSWTVREVAVVQSHLDGAGARYRTVATAPLRSG